MPPAETIRDSRVSDYTLMTIVELQAEFADLAQQLLVIEGKRKLIDSIMERRKAEASARAMVNTMSPLEKDALRTVLK